MKLEEVIETLELLKLESEQDCERSINAAAAQADDEPSTELYLEVCREEAKDAHNASIALGIAIDALREKWDL